MSLIGIYKVVYLTLTVKRIHLKKHMQFKMVEEAED